MYCADCGECIVEEHEAADAVALSCARCGRLHEFGVWERLPQSQRPSAVPARAMGAMGAAPIADATPSEPSAATSAVPSESPRGDSPEGAVDAGEATDAIAPAVSHDADGRGARDELFPERLTLPDAEVLDASRDSMLAEPTAATTAATNSRGGRVGAGSTLMGLPMLATAPTEPAPAAPPRPSPTTATRSAKTDAASPPPTPRWLVSFDNKDDDRELTQAEVVAALRAGTLAPSRLAWRRGMDGWLALEDIPAFAAACVGKGKRAAGATSADRVVPAEDGKLAAKSPPAQKREQTNPDMDVDVDVDVDDAVDDALTARRAPVSDAPVSDALATALLHSDAAVARVSETDVDWTQLASSPPAAASRKRSASGRGRAALAALAAGLCLVGGGLLWQSQGDGVADPRVAEATTTATEERAAPDAVGEAAAAVKVATAQQVVAPPAAPTPEPSKAASETPLGAEAERPPEAAPPPSALTNAPPPVEARDVGAPASRPSAAPEAHGARTTPAAAARDANRKPERGGAAAASAAVAETAESFSATAAGDALLGAARRASKCRKPGDPSGVAKVEVWFAPSGRVTSATVNGKPFAGTPTGGCIAATLRTARIPPFGGERRMVAKTLVIQ